MKNIIYTIILLSIVSCNGQKKTETNSSNQKVNNQRTEEAKIEESDKNGDINLSVNYKFTYNETLKIPEETIKDLPPSIKTEFLKMLKEEIHYTLIINDFESKYEIVKNDKLTKSINEKDLDNNKSSNTTLNLPQEEIYKNQKDNLYIRKRDFFKEIYLISDKLEIYNWEIKNDKMKIGEFNCKKAILKTKEGIVTAWFTDEIPISEGPSMYYGLPGMILKLDASDRNYDLVKIEKIDKKIEIKKPKDGKVISKNEFQKLVDKNKNKTKIEESVEEHIEE